MSPNVTVRSKTKTGFAVDIDDSGKIHDIANIDYSEVLMPPPPKKRAVKKVVSKKVSS